jgi:hypothetical protein
MSTYGFTISIMSYKEEIDIFFDTADTMEYCIDISEICEMEPNPDGTESNNAFPTVILCPPTGLPSPSCRTKNTADTMEYFIDISEICEMEPNPDGTESAAIEQPYSISSTWPFTIAQRVLDDIITDHPLFTKIEALLIMDDEFLITFRNPHGTDRKFGRPNTFRHKMENVIKTNKMFHIMIKLQSAGVASLGLRPRKAMAVESMISLRICHAYKAITQLIS